MMSATMTGQSVIPKSVTGGKNVNLYSYIANNTTDQGYNGNISANGALDNNLTSKIPPSNLYEQLIVPVSENWFSFGNLSLGALASNEFYGSNQANT